MPTQSGVRGFLSLRSAVSALVPVLCAAITMAVAIAGGVQYKDGPPTGHTGGFGEPTCQHCHSDLPPGDSLMTIALSGVPEPFVVGERYELQLTVAHPQMRAGGFQLSARYAAGDVTGRQAGVLASSDDVRVAADSFGVQYASHAAPQAGASASWVLEWVAPPVRQPVVFHVSANASNFDDSEFGDMISSASFRSEAPETEPTTREADSSPVDGTRRDYRP